MSRRGLDRTKTAAREREPFVLRVDEDGVESYGRAPTFLMLTGYEQVRSVVAAITGSLEDARRVRLVLPETGVCGTDPAPEEVPTSCCTSVPVRLERPLATPAACC